MLVRRCLSMKFNKIWYLSPVNNSQVQKISKLGNAREYFFALEDPLLSLNTEFGKNLKTTF